MKIVIYIIHKLVTLGINDKDLYYKKLNQEKIALHISPIKLFKY